MSGLSGSGTQPWQKPAASFQQAGQVYWRHSRQKRKRPWNGIARVAPAVSDASSSARMPSVRPRPFSMRARWTGCSKAYFVPQRSQNDSIWVPGMDGGADLLW